MISWAKTTAAAFLGALLALLGFVLVRSEPFCALNETAAPCFREWIGALSGWAAAIGALVAVAWTLPSLRRQVKEAQAQTKFLLGDSPPTLEIFESLDAFEVNTADFRIVNWNRRSFNIVAITVAAGGDANDYHAALVDFLINDQEAAERDLRHRHDQFRHFHFRRPIFLLGWEDRSKGPATFQGGIIIAVNREQKKPVVREINLTVRGVLSSGSQIELHARGTFEVQG